MRCEVGVLQCYNIPVKYLHSAGLKKDLIPKSLQRNSKIVINKNITHLKTIFSHFTIENISSLKNLFTT